MHRDEFEDSDAAALLAAEDMDSGTGAGDGVEASGVDYQQLVSQHLDAVERGEEMQFVDTRLSEKSCECERMDVIRAYIVMVLGNFASSALFAFNLSKTYSCEMQPTGYGFEERVCTVDASKYYPTAIGSVVSSFAASFAVFSLFHSRFDCDTVCCELCCPCIYCCSHPNSNIFLGVYCCRCTKVHSVRWLYYQRHVKGISAIVDVISIIFALFNLNLLGILHVVFNVLKIGVKMVGISKGKEKAYELAQQLGVHIDLTQQQHKL
eukprot:TRINITY_DN65615_c0_g1_i1.p1 TRINITY_DN65615_c0_g1~~TRINITY_DN65615_c0_g1_i1.p1  ORF type:complete len:265 (-),score=104.64 TRINITY_DN65615_c0_g1_i1:68-862(-)